MPTLSAAENPDMRLKRRTILVDPGAAPPGPGRHVGGVKGSNVTASAPRQPIARPSRRKLTTPDYQALGAFRLALRRFLAFSEAGAQALGLTPQQHQALLAVRAHAGPAAMSVGELANCLLIKNHSALGLADRLVRRGFLVRGPAPHDRRRVVLTLTEAGSQALETISRNNLGKLKGAVPVFADLLQALEQLDLPTPREVASKPRGGSRSGRET